jgi:hypothetical protein
VVDWLCGEMGFDPHETHGLSKDAAPLLEALRGGYGTATERHFATAKLLVEKYNALDAVLPPPGDPTELSVINSVLTAIARGGNVNILQYIVRECKFPVVPIVSVKSSWFAVSGRHAYLWQLFLRIAGWLQRFLGCL